MVLIAQILMNVQTIQMIAIAMQLALITLVLLHVLAMQVTQVMVPIVPT
jgi:hypothetical protein